MPWVDFYILLRDLCLSAVGISEIFTVLDGDVCMLYYNVGYYVSDRRSDTEDMCSDT